MVKIKKIGKILGLITLALLMAGVIGYGMVYYITDKELKKEFQKIRDAGEPLTLDELYSSPIPDEENAALIYQKVFTIMDADKEEINRINNLFSNKKLKDWSDEDKEIASQLIQRDKEIFTLLEEGVQKPKCRFPVRYEKEPPMESLVPYIANMRRCAQLLRIKAYLEANNGDVKEAIKTCITGLRLGESLFQEPLLIGQMFMVSIDTIMVYTIEDIMSQNEVGAAVYHDLYTSLKRVREKSSINLKWERCFSTDYTLRHKKSEVVCIKDRKLKNTIRTLYSTKLGRPWVRIEQIYYLRTMAKVISVSRKPYRQAINILDEYKKSIPKYCISTKMLAESIKGFFKHEAYHDALMGAGEIAMELRIYKSQHGEYPDSLEELAINTPRELPLDPFTGESYIYRKENEGFIVYSAGADFKDDGGIDKRHEGENDIDIVWRCEI